MMATTGYSSAATSSNPKIGYRRAHPEGPVANILPPVAHGETTWVTLNVTDVPPDYARCSSTPTPPSVRDWIDALN